MPATTRATSSNSASVTPAPSRVPAPSSVAEPAITEATTGASAAGSQVSPASWDYSMARRLTVSLSDALRRLADALPAAERSLEEQVPAVEDSLRWASEVRPENFEVKAKEAMPVVGRTVAQGAEAVARAGLRSGAWGVKMTAEQLPMAGQALHSTMEKAMPSVQAGAHASAGLTRSLAEKAAQLSGPASSAPQSVQRILGPAPQLLGGAAAGLDLLGDAAPGTEAAVAYGAGKAMPVVQAALGAVAEVANDAAQIDSSKLPSMPEPSKVTSAMRSVGLDPDRLTANADSLVQQATSKLSMAFQRKAPGAIVQE